LVDGSQRRIERCLLGREGLVPDRRTTEVIFDFENPTCLAHGPIDANVQRDAALADALAERRVDYLMLPLVILQVVAVLVFVEFARVVVLEAIDSDGLRQASQDASRVVPG